MNIPFLRSAVFLLAATAGCASNAPADVDGHGSIPHPQGDGKQDGEVSCGSSACAASECAFDCSTSGQTCHKACMTDERANAFVAASVAGAEQVAFDSRQTPYQPKLALDNVLIYGCEVWDFSAGNHQGLELEYIELIHDSLVVDPTDPTRHHNRLDVYVDPLAGPGTYRGEGSFTASDAAAAAGRRYTSSDGCSVTLDAMGGGTFDCALQNQAGASISVSGSFSCPGSAMNQPEFIAWQPM
jgi:hypothetical protein